jgi:hypothetical protein
MVRVRTGASPQDVLQGAKHILFVEGKRDGLDVAVLEKLLSPKLRVEPLGPSFSVRSVATALREFHPEYWFVIDRDDWADDKVEASWECFPDPAHDNLLIWRKKELESYFLEPDWVCRSRYLGSSASAEGLKKWRAGEADRLLWLEAANRVLIKSRSSIKQQKGALLTPGEVQGFNREQVVIKLLGSPLLASLGSSMAVELSEERLRAAFDEQVVCLSGGTQPLVWGQGRWRDLILAKAIFRTMVNRWFDVPDQSRAAGARLTGKDAERAVAVDLLLHHQDAMPTDFSELKKVLNRVL